MEELFQVRDIAALVVDDNAVNRMVASNVMLQYGMEVEEAESGSEAVAKCRERAYDFVFMDYLMPDMNGVEATRQIRGLRRKEETTIIGLSANVPTDLVEEFEIAGANGVLAKPLEIARLSEVLLQHIPKEKIVSEEEPEESEAIEERGAPDGRNEEEILSLLRGVEGLDMERGLFNVMGAVDTYVKVLDVCCANVTEQIDYIKAAYGVIATSGLKIYFHSIKGVLSNIGADGLSELSKKMEAAARDQDEAYVKENIASYVEQMERFNDSLKRAVEGCKDLLFEEPQGPHKPMPEWEFRQKTDKLLECLRLFEFNEINELMEELLPATEGKKHKALKAAYDYVQQFQYDEALEQAKALRE